MSPLSIVTGVALREEPGLGAMTLPGFLREVTTRFADREALVLYTPEGIVRWTYQMLWEQAVQIARALLGCGVGKDSRVGILMTNRPEWVAAFFGAGLAGGVAVALSTFSTAPELEYLLQASCVSILLFERKLAKKDFAAMLLELAPQIRTAPAGELKSTRFPFLRRLAAVDDAGAAGGIESWSDFLAHGNAIPSALLDATRTTVKPHDGETLDEAAIRDFLRQRLASYKVPRRVLFVREEEVTLTGSSKIKGSAVRELVSGRLTS